MSGKQGYFENGFLTFYFIALDKEPKTHISSSEGRFERFAGNRHLKRTKGITESLHFEVESEPKNLRVNMMFFYDIRSFMMIK